MLVVIAVIAVGAFAATAWIGGGGDAAAPPPPTTTGPPPLAQLKIIFPEGFTVREMADRVAAVRADRDRQARRDAEAHARGVPPCGEGRAAAAALPQGREARLAGGVPVSRLLRLHPGVERAGARLRLSCARSASASASVDLRYARSKNLTPYDILIIASMIEKETAVPRERRLVAAVIYNRLRNRMPLGIDATIRYGLDIPGTQSLTKEALRSTRRTTRGCGPACRRRRSRIPASPRSSAAANPARNVDYLYYVRKPKSLTHYFTARRERLPPQGLRVRLRVQVTLANARDRRRSLRDWTRRNTCPVSSGRQVRKKPDVNTAYQVTGEGPLDLVFVPGYVTHLELQWAIPTFSPFLERLSSFSRLIRFDKRGTGSAHRSPSGRDGAARGGPVSSTVKDLVAGSGLRFRERGSAELRGVAEEWRLYAVERPSDAPGHEY